MKPRASISRFMLSSTLMGILALTVFVLSLPSLYAADPVGWADLELYGGQINDIAIDAVEPNTLFAGSYQGDGLFKSTDGGATWQSVDGFRNEVVYSISFDPREHRTIWVATYGYIYKSEDGGLTWQVKLDAQKNNRGFFSLVIDPLNSTTIYVGTTGLDGSNNYARVYKTADGGATWQQTSLRADHSVVDLAINPQNTQEIWAVTGPRVAGNGSIYRSRDGGTSWKKINTGIPFGGWFEVVVINPQDPSIVYVGGENGLYRTKDGGANWDRDTSILSLCRAFALDPQNPDTLYASHVDGNRDSISKSTDGGDTWATYSISPLQFICLTVEPQNPQVLYGGDIMLGIVKSTDSGQTWQLLYDGIRANPVFASAISPSGRLLVGSGSGVFLKSQGGKWEWVHLGRALAVAFSPEDENTIYAGILDYLGRSNDFGLTWRYVRIPSSSSAMPHLIGSIAINPQEPENLYLGVGEHGGEEGEIYKSTDGGESMRLVKSLPVPVNVVKANLVNPQVVYAGSGMFYAPGAPGAVYKSIDGGENWEGTGLNGKCVNALATDPENLEIVYAGCGLSDGTHSGIFKSIDGGTSWEAKDFGIPVGDPKYAAIVDLEIDPENRNIIYAATDLFGTYISHDGGDYWTLLGLSDYELYDILVPPPSSTSLEIRKLSENETIPSSNVYAGSGSGMLEFTGSGIGVVAGMVTNIKTRLGITGASLSTASGGAALSLTGNYVMIVPAGVCQVSAKAEGCLGTSKRNVSVTSGDDTTVDLALTPLPSNISIKKFETNATGPVPVGSQVTFTAEAEASGSTTLYYRFYVASGYATPNYGNWQMIQDFSTTNTCSWTPQAEGNYVIVVWVTDDPTSGVSHQVGIAVSTTSASSSPVQITELQSNISYPLNTGTSVTLTADATGGSGTMRYQFWVTDGTNWNSLQAYSTNNTCTWTPSEAGCYIIVVWASDTEATQSPPLAGWTCTVQ